MILIDKSRYNDDKDYDAGRHSSTRSIALPFPARSRSNRRTPMATEEKEKLSPVETIKTQSQYLRGDIAQELVDGNDHFGKDSVHLLKNHGLYQQDDRDERAAGRTTGGK